MMDFEENKIKPSSKAQKKLDLEDTNQGVSNQPNKRGFWRTFFDRVRERAREREAAGGYSEIFDNLNKSISNRITDD